MSTQLNPAEAARPLPLARPAGVLRGHEAHEVLGRLVARVAAAQPEVDASLAAETDGGACINFTHVYRDALKGGPQVV